LLGSFIGASAAKYGQEIDEVMLNWMLSLAGAFGAAIANAFRMAEEEGYERATAIIQRTTNSWETDD
jgi:hypothetical protein